MIVKQKKTKDLVEGDILIIDWLEIVSKKLPIFIAGSSSQKKLLKKKVEGESLIMLFEIDDIDVESIKKADGKRGSKWTFHHIDGLLKGMPTIEVETGDYEWTVILNPFHKLKHYKDMIRLRNSVNRAVNDGDKEAESVLTKKFKNQYSF